MPQKTKPNTKFKKKRKNLQRAIQYDTKAKLCRVIITLILQHTAFTFLAFLAKKKLEPLRKLSKSETKEKKISQLESKLETSTVGMNKKKDDFKLS